jgi:hypothetical protein
MHRPIPTNAHRLRSLPSLPYPEHIGNSESRGSRGAEGLICDFDVMFPSTFHLKFLVMPFSIVVGSLPSVAKSGRRRWRPNDIEHGPSVSHAVRLANLAAALAGIEPNSSSGCATALALVELDSVYHNLLRLPELEEAQCASWRHLLQHSGIASLFGLRILHVVALPAPVPFRSISGSRSRGVVHRLEPNEPPRLLDRLGAHPVWLQNTPQLAIRTFEPFSILVGAHLVDRIWIPNYSEHARGPNADDSTSFWCFPWLGYFGIRPAAIPRIPDVCQNPVEGDEFAADDAITPSLIREVCGHLHSLVELLPARPQQPMDQLRSINTCVSVLQAYGDECLVTGLVQHIQVGRNSMI